MRHRETLLAEWDKLTWQNKLDLLWRSLGAFWDALCLQPRRLEDEMFQDLRYGIRRLLKNPGFTLLALLTLSLGIGATTAMATDQLIPRRFLFAGEDKLYVRLSPDGRMISYLAR